MASPPLPSETKRHQKRQVFWYKILVRSLILFALSSGVGGLFVGGVMGVADWATQSLGRSWWYWGGWTAGANSLFMMILGVSVGIVVFLVTALLSLRWRKERKRRLARSLKTGLFFPLAVSMALAPLVFALGTAALVGPATIRWGTRLMDFEMLTLAVAPVLLMGRLMYLSKVPRPQKPIQILQERLLPLD